MTDFLLMVGGALGMGVSNVTSSNGQSVMAFYVDVRSKDFEIFGPGTACSGAIL